MSLFCNLHSSAIKRETSTIYTLNYPSLWPGKGKCFYNVTLYSIFKKHQKHPVWIDLHALLRMVSRDKVSEKRRRRQEVQSKLPNSKKVSETPQCTYVCSYLQEETMGGNTGRRKGRRDRDGRNSSEYTTESLCLQNHIYQRRTNSKNKYVLLLCLNGVYMVGFS